MADTLIPETLDLTDEYTRPPEYEAGVALVLWRAVVRAERCHCRNIPPRAYLLDAFTECLQAANGKRIPGVIDELPQRLVKH